MTYLLFLDESGHHRRDLPYEVRGGIALHITKLWSFIKGMRALETAAFGDNLHKYGSELKGSKLLDKYRFRWAAQGPRMADDVRREHARLFLNKGRSRQVPTRHEFTAYGQACLEMALGIFEVLHANEAAFFATVVPQHAPPPWASEFAQHIRRDHATLLECYYQCLEERSSMGLLVMDATDKTEDRGFVDRLARHFTESQAGLQRASRIVPAPFFVSSDMTYPIQAADVCLYCTNWGLRRPAQGINAPVRPEIAERFAPWLEKLEFSRVTPAGVVTGLCYVPSLHE